MEFCNIQNLNYVTLVWGRGGGQKLEKLPDKQAVTANGSGSGEIASKDLKDNKKKANGVWKRGSLNMAKSLTSLWPSLICKIKETNYKGKKNNYFMFFSRI